MWAVCRDKRLFVVSVMKFRPRSDDGKSNVQTSEEFSQKHFFVCLQTHAPKEAALQKSLCSTHGLHTASCQQNTGNPACMSKRACASVCHMDRGAKQHIFVTEQGITIWSTHIICF